MLSPLYLQVNTNISIILQNDLKLNKYLGKNSCYEKKRIDLVFFLKIWFRFPSCEGKQEAMTRTNRLRRESNEIWSRDRERVRQREREREREGQRERVAENEKGVFLTRTRYTHQAEQKSINFFGNSGPIWINILNILKQFLDKVFSYKRGGMEQW